MFVSFITRALPELDLAEVCHKCGVELLLPLNCPWLEFFKSVPISGTAKCGCSSLRFLVVLLLGHFALLQGGVVWRDPSGALASGSWVTLVASWPMV